VATYAPGSPERLEEGRRRVEPAACREACEKAIEEVMRYDEETQQTVWRFLLKTIETTRVFAKKQADYGPQNIAEFGLAGVIVRLNDKMARIKHLIGRQAMNEPLADSFLDVANYGLIALMILDGEWPNVQRWRLVKEETI